MPPLKKVLIANRGEIACRIIRTARTRGMATVAVYSDADVGTPHVRLADEAVAIGPAPAAQSYLRIDRIIEAAKSSGADCVHPGYGFLSENPELAEACAAAGLAFVGPAADAMRQLGNKAAAKALATGLGVPVVPGYAGAAQDAATLSREAKRIGFPVMIKAAAGGGGRGMRLVSAAEQFAEALDSAHREAEAAFGDARVLIEKAILKPRHVEVQVFADRHGNVVHLYERDCSLQRRHQKIIEEAPAPGMSAALRAKLCGDAVRLAKAGRYEGAGTVEFLIEGGRLDEHAPYYFIEMNTRLQVEHPVTEAVTGLDLVDWQFSVACGDKLPLAQDRIKLAGHAVEARICAEDAARAFTPVTGRIAALRLAGVDGVRVDSGIEEGSQITPFYDSMIAKAIAHGQDRAHALARLAAWLEASAILGLRSNMGFLHALVTDRAVAAGELDTGLIGRELARLAPLRSAGGAMVARGAALLMEHDATAGRDGSPWGASDAFQTGGARQTRRLVEVDGERVSVVVAWNCGEPRVEVDGAAADGDLPAVYDPSTQAAFVATGGQHIAVRWPRYDASSAAAGGDGAIRAPITGRIARIDVQAGQSIAAGEAVAVVEAMKMEHVLHALIGGRVAELAVSAGQQVTQGDLIALVEAEGAP